MNAIVNIVCYRQKTLKNGEHPLMIRVTKNRKVKYKSLGISVKVEYPSLKKIAKLAGINVNLTTYVARHSFATILKNSGVSPIVSFPSGLTEKEEEEYIKQTYHGSNSKYPLYI